MNHNNYDYKSFKKLVYNSIDDKLVFHIGIVSRIVSTLLSLYLTYRLKDLIDKFSMQSSRNNLLVELSVFFVIFLLLIVISNYFMEIAGIQIETKLRKKILEKNLYLPTEIIEENIERKISSKLIYDTSIIYKVVSKYWAQFISGILSILISLIIIFSIDFRLTIITIGILILCLLIIYPISKKKSLLKRQMSFEDDKVSEFSNKIMSNNLLIKIFGTEENIKRQGNRLVNSTIRNTLKQSESISILGPIIEKIIVAIIFLVLVLGGIRVNSQLLTIGELMIFIMYMVQILLPTYLILSSIGYRDDAFDASHRITTLLSEKEESKKGILIEDNKFSVEFKEVFFELDEKRLLKNLSFNIKDRQKICIVGNNKENNRLILKLIEKIYSNNSGEININDESLDNISIKSLRSKIGYISSDLPLIKGTIRDNILYGTNKYMPDNIILKYCEFLDLQNFILSLDDQLDTDIGKNGIILTEEQRHKINFVRALIRRPSILLIDNISENLNNKAKEEINIAIDNLHKELTIIISSDDIINIENSDKIIFIVDGELKVVGNHKKLIVNNELYAKYIEKIDK